MFRPCPSFPGYSVTADGIVRSDSRPSKTPGAPPTKDKILKAGGNSKNHYKIGDRWLTDKVLIADAWSTNLDGYVHYDDYRVIVIERPPVEGFE